MKGEKRRERRGRRRRRKPKKGMEFVKFCMELVWKLLFWYGLLDFWAFVWNCLMKKKQKTLFFFFMNLGLKEPYLVYWLCFGLGLVDCNPQLRNICIKEILGF